MSRIEKCWSRILRMDSLEIVRSCYEWQINNPQVDGHAKKLKEELGKIGLAYMWQSQYKINVNICKIITERCNDIKRRGKFSNIRSVPIFWDITPCSQLRVNQRFGGTYRLHLKIQ
jgi:hypothetical protein